MSENIIWALDQRERCIACPSTPRANAVVLQLSRDGALDRDGVARWATAGVMAAGGVWPGVEAELSDDDWLDLEDAVTGLSGLAQVVALHGQPGTEEIVQALAERTGVQYVTCGEEAALLAQLASAAPA